MARHYSPRGGRLGPVVDTPQAAAIQGIRQRGGPYMPPACPHCRAEPPSWMAGEWIGCCLLCGATWYRTVYELARLRPHSGNPHPARLPNMMPEDEA